MKKTCKNCERGAEERGQRSEIQSLSVVMMGPMCMCADLDEDSDFCCKLWQEERKDETRMVENPVSEQTMKNLLGEECEKLPGQINMLEELEDMENMANGKDD